MDCGPADGSLIEKGFLAERRVDQEVDLPALDVIRNVRTAFVNLIDGLDGHSGITQNLSCAASRDDVESHTDQV